MEEASEARGVRMMKAIALMYHDIVAEGGWDASGFPGADAALYKIERGEFDKHLAAIARVRAGAPTTIFEILSGKTIDSTKDQTPWLLTFDDGGASAIEIADALEARGWRGHFFITAGYINQQSFLTSAQIQDLRQRGHIIGSHSYSHPVRMSACSRAEMLREWQTSTDTLSEILNERVSVASVPGGYYSDEVAETAAQSGIEALFTSEPTTKCARSHNCLILGRYTIQRWMSAEVAAHIALGKITPRLRQAALWKAKKITKAIGGEQYLKIRKLLLKQGSSQS